MFTASQPPSVFASSRVALRLIRARPALRDQQLDPKLYYPEGFMPELLEDWPVDGDLVVPVDNLPPNLKNSMGDRWRTRKANEKILKEQAEQKD